MTPLRYLRNVAVLLDVAFNVLVLFSYEVETLSRRAGRARSKKKRWGCVLCGLINPVFRLFGVEDHCDQALKSRHPI